MLKNSLLLVGVIEFGTMPSYLCKVGTADGRVVVKEFEATTKAKIKEK